MSVTKRTKKGSRLENTTSPKKTAVKKRSVNKRSAKSSRSTETAALKSKEQFSATKSVRLPKNMSKRSIEKTVVLQSEIDKYFYNSMYKISYIAGICFVLVGAAFAASQFTQVSVTKMMMAELVSSDSSTIPLQESNLAEPPTFALITDIPDVILEPHKTTFTVTNAEQVSTFLTKSGQTVGMKLDTAHLNDDTYRTVIPFTSPGKYYLQFYVTAKEGGYKSYFTSVKEFQIGSDETLENFSKLQNDSQQEDAGTVEEDSQSGNNEDLIEDTESLGGSVTQNSEVFIDENKSDFALFISNGESTLSGNSVLGVVAPADYQYIELYARPLHSLNSRFISLAVKRYGGWQFVFDSNNLPNGAYEFFAQTKLGGEFTKSTSLTLEVKNQTIRTNITDNTVSVDNDAETVGIPLRELVSIKDEQTEQVVDLEDTIKRETDDLIKEHSATLDELLRRYAVAVQSGDQMMIDLARQALEEGRKSIAFSTLRDDRLQDISGDIDRELERVTHDLKSRVETFEQMRKERSGGSTSLDSDGDGISDYDEEYIYKTDPNSVDTDNDGVPDGVEIMRGYNPNDPTPEVIIEYESPKEIVGLVRDDVLVVDEVTPVLRVEPEESVPPVRTEIRGRGLANSFVTLFIYSNPVVVTVRTDADGSFVYRFDKELEDGRHDVYVAVTDNAGKIIAQSNPFSFIKEAEAYSPVGTTEAQVTTTDTIIDTTAQTYNMAIGLGVLALGIILVMLGISLRPRRNPEADPDSVDGDLSKSDESTQTDR